MRSTVLANFRDGAGWPFLARRKEPRWERTIWLSPLGGPLRRAGASQFGGSAVCGRQVG